MGTPLHTVTEKFGSKAELVGQLIGTVSRGEGETDAELTERLMRVSNRKLLVLHKREADLKSRFGTREKLVATLVEKKLGRADADLQQKLDQYSTGRLLSMSRGL